MKIFNPIMDILPPSQKRLWPELEAAPDLGYVLYGGTAIALRLGHRDSVDFDFFSGEPLNKELIKDSFPFISISTTLQDSQNTWVVLVPYGDSEKDYVKVSFFGGISYGRVGEPEFTDDVVLQVASLEDLMATKLKVILQRAEAKDYRDVAAMINAGIKLDEGLSAARLLYGPNFQPSESLKALLYFGDGDLHTLTSAEKQTLASAVSSIEELPAIKLSSEHIYDSSWVAECSDDENLEAEPDKPKKDSSFRLG